MSGLKEIRNKLRLTIGTKLVGLIAVLLMTSIVSLVWLSTRMFIEDNTALIQQMNSDTAASLATQARELFENITEKMRVMGTAMMGDGSAAQAAQAAAPGAPPTTAPAPAQNRVLDEFFAKDKELLAVFLHQHADDGNVTVAGKALSPDTSSADAGGAKILETVLAAKEFSLSQVAKGEIALTSIKLPDDSAAVAVAVPFIAGQQEGTFTHTLLAVIKQSRFTKAFAESDIVTSYMVDRKGRLLAHPDVARVAAGESVANLGIVKQLLEGKFNNGQTRYVEPASREARLGAFKLVGFGGLGVVAEVPEAKAFEAAKRVEYRSILVAFIVLCISFFTGFFFSGTITWPIKQLVSVAHRISEGDFNVHLKPKGRDEVAALSYAFNDMAKGLEERDRVKETFNKFHNKEIAEKLLSGEVKLGGERREATIFFSDVRGFTGMSETMEPEQVVEMLNEYMTRMVSVVLKNNGIVDKYVGDAIMALWGVPLGGENDTCNAVRACIEMRQELAKLNELRISRGQPPLKIGMGVNTGQVIAGNIGSNEKMEYTVIGDSVNLASRIESMTKEYGTDCLISKSIHDKVKDRFIFETCAAARVKGKTEAIEIFQLKGYYDEQNKPVIVETPYSSYKAEKSDKAVHDKPAAETPAAATTPAAPPATPLLTPLPNEANPVAIAVEVVPVALEAAPVAAAQDADTQTGNIVMDLATTTTLTRPESTPVEPVESGIVLPELVVAPARTGATAPGSTTAEAKPAPAILAQHAPAPEPAPIVPAAHDAADETALARVRATKTAAYGDYKKAVDDGPPYTATETMFGTLEAPAEDAAAVPAAATVTEATSKKQDEWYFKVGDEVFGAFTRDEIRQGLAARELSTQMLIGRSNGGPWIPLSKHPEFSELVHSLEGSASLAA